MIGIGGLARSGKDTLAINLAEIIEEDWKMDVQIFSFADALKEKINPFITKEFGISAFSEDTEDKKIIRPMLVAYGESMKTKYGQDVWYSELSNNIEQALHDDRIFPIISDVRFDFEARLIQDNGGQVIHITKQGNEPPNEIEALNDPLVESCADLAHTWPLYSPDLMDECRSHADILWQMIKEGHQEKWKKIYI
jgi:hypothetical protein